MKKKIIRFPHDFKFRNHPIGMGSQFCYPDFEDVKISIIIGDVFYSNGVDTYEMFDFREEDPRGYLSVIEINQHLVNNPM